MYQIVHTNYHNRFPMKLRRIGYNQTVVEYNNGSEVFFSYDTPVAARLQDYEYLRTQDFYSKTTSRHINKYLETINNVSVIPQKVIDNITMELPANVSSTEHNS